MASTSLPYKTQNTHPSSQPPTKQPLDPPDLGIDSVGIHPPGIHESDTITLMGVRVSGYQGLDLGVASFTESFAASCVTTSGRV